jgi:uncharacterized membrane protein YgcG
MNITRSVLTVLTTLVVAASLSAQERNQAGKPIPRGVLNDYVVSAKAGVVNIVEGEASVIRARPFAVPEMLISGDELQPGDAVNTGTDGRAEILLNPGCYLRLGNGSQFVFLFDGFTSNTVKLLRGSAVLEASVMDGDIFVETPKNKFEIERTGIYRFNVGIAPKPEIVVRKGGRALLGDAMIKDGRQAIVEDSTPVIAKLNKNDVDALDDWSKSRAKALIAANNNLSSSGMRRNDGIASLRNNAWIYDPFCRCYTFLPYSGGFTSAYGWEYSNYNPYWYRFAWPGYYNGGAYSGNRGSGNRGGSSGSGRSGGNGGSGGGNAGGGHHHYDPPRTPVLSDPGRGASGGARGGDRETRAPTHRHPQ